MLVKESQDFPKEGSGAIVARRKGEPRSSASAVGKRVGQLGPMVLYLQCPKTLA